MKDPRYRGLDLSIKAVAVVVTFGGIAFGYRQFLAEWELANRTPFMELQTKFYLEIVETASKIAHPKDIDEQSDAVKRFWQLYVGASGIVEDAEVENAVEELSECLLPDRVKCDRTDLEACAMTLSGAVRSSLFATWGIGSTAKRRSGE